MKLGMLIQGIHVVHIETGTVHFLRAHVTMTVSASQTDKAIDSINAIATYCGIELEPDAFGDQTLWKPTEDPVTCEKCLKEET